jgi:hypothetical protein
MGVLINGVWTEGELRQNNHWITSTLRRKLESMNFPVFLAR